MKETLITSNKSTFIEKVEFQYNGQIGLITYHFKTGQVIRYKTNQVIRYKTNTQQDLLNVYIGTYYGAVGEIYNKLVKGKLEVVAKSEPTKKEEVQKPKDNTKEILEQLRELKEIKTVVSNQLEENLKQTEELRKKLKNIDIAIDKVLESIK